jgi:hypothetical protein
MRTARSSSSRRFTVVTHECHDPSKLRLPPGVDPPKPRQGAYFYVTARTIPDARSLVEEELSKRGRTIRALNIDIREQFHAYLLPLEKK